MKSKIHQQNQNHKLKPTIWGKLVQTVLNKTNHPNVALNTIICDDETILSLNREYLEHDYVTDVISFPNFTDDPLFLGEIYIDLDQAIRQAEEYGETPPRELARLIIHGILHLTGYNDMDDSQREIMVCKQEALLAELNDAGIIPSAL